jgi:hypothetical protein
MRDCSYDIVRVRRVGCAHPPVPTRRNHAPGQKQRFGLELGWLVRRQFIAPVERNTLERKPFHRRSIQRRYATYDGQ